MLRVMIASSFYEFAIMAWLLVSRALPIMSDYQLLYPRSEPVIVYMDSKQQQFARYVRMDEDGDQWSGRWVSECSNGWDLTDHVTHWRPSLEAPTDKVEPEPIKGFFIEQEQLDQLRLIETGWYGDGTHLTPDRRRDLANSLHTFIGAISSQPVQV